MTRDQGKATKQDMIRLKAEALKTWIECFLRDCRIRDLSAHTVEYYRARLAAFESFAPARDVIGIEQITPDLIRAYLLHLQETGHNAPKVTHAPIESVPLEDIRAMLATCDDGFTGIRDKAIILCLLDTGARAREFLALDLSDVDTIGGAVLIRMGRGGSPGRYLSGASKARRVLRAYLKQRTDKAPALWVTSMGDRLAVSSLEGMLKSRGKRAGVTPPSPHDFRRAIALMMLRAGTDVITLSRLMGHATLEVLRRYLAQSNEDLQAAHGVPGEKNCSSDPFCELY